MLRKCKSDLFPCSLVHKQFEDVKKKAIDPGLKPVSIAFDQFSSPSSTAVSVAGDLITEGDSFTSLFFSS